MKNIFIENIHGRYVWLFTLYDMKQKLIKNIKCCSSYVEITDVNFKH